MPNLIELLPVSTEAVLKTIQDKINFLKTYRYFIQCVIKAFETLLAGNLQKLDAHVGDTACQIRAYYFYLQYQKLQHNLFNEKKLKLSDLLIALDQILIHLSNKQPEKEFLTIAAFINQSNLNIVIENEQCPVFMAFFLASFVNIDEKSKASLGINYTGMVTAIPNFSRKQSEKITKSFQKALAELSCQFIKDIALELDLFNSHSQEVIEAMIRFDQVSRPVIPAFLSGLIIIEHIIKNRNFICLQVDTVEPMRIYMQGVPETNRLVEINYAPFENSKVTFNIQAHVAQNTNQSDVYNYLKHTDFKEIILGAFASHPQYACATLQNFNKNTFSEKSPISENCSSILQKVTTLFENFINIFTRISAQAKKIDYYIYHVYSGKLT